jgi:hypothetical protein
MPPRRRGHAIWWISAGLMVAVIAAGVAWILVPPKRTLRLALAEAFARPAEVIELNVPPAADRYPATLLITPTPGELLVYRSAQRAVGVSGPVTEINATADGSAQASILTEILGSASSSADLSVTINLHSLRVYELQVEPFIKQLVNDTNLVENAQKWKPRVIHRAYEALLTIEMTHKGSVDAQLWREQKAMARKMGASLKADNKLAYTTKEPVVVAFESLDLEFFSKSAGSSPDSVRTIEHSIQLPQSSGSSARASETAPSKVHYSLIATIGEGASNELRMARPSVDDVNESLGLLGAQPLPGFERLFDPTTERLSEFFSGAARAAQRAGSQSLIVYYVGHAYAGHGGQEYLILKDYHGSLKRDLGNDLLVGAAREELEAPGAAMPGTQFGGLLDAVKAIQAEGAEPEGGLFPVSAAARLLSSSGVRFAFLLDGCFEHDEVVRLRTQLGLTQRGDYVGAHLNGGPEAMHEFTETLREFSAAPYLRKTDVVLIAAAPGTLAIEQPHPGGSWTSELTLAPLAVRLHRLSRLRTFANWGDLLRSARDIGSTGEIRTAGTVSWSDFSEFGALALAE